MNIKLYSSYNRCFIWIDWVQRYVIRINLDREKATALDVDDTTAEFDAEGQNQETESCFEAREQNIGTESKGNGGKSVSLGEVKLVNAAEFGNPGEVLDLMLITSNVEVKRIEDFPYMRVVKPGICL